MTSDKGIFIRNIYYMLAYAFQTLKPGREKDIAAEDFEDAEDLLAEILFRGLSALLRQGLHREYAGQCEDLPTLRGRLDMHGTMRNVMQRKMRLCCIYDEFTEDNPANRILKSTVILLIGHPRVKQERKKALKNILPFWGGVRQIDLALIHWDRLAYPPRQRAYAMLLRLCEFIARELLLTTEKGKNRMQGFSEEWMHRLFENFVLEYYRREHPALHAASREVQWDLTKEPDPVSRAQLPGMKTDIMLQDGSSTLIIDTKYYGKSLSFLQGKSTLHSANLYQIFSYVKNRDREGKGNVSGLLLYARTGSGSIDCRYEMGGSSIAARTLDLNKDFIGIRKQLDLIAWEYFPAEARKTA